MYIHIERERARLYIFHQKLTQNGPSFLDIADPRPLPPITVEKPTMSISIGVNKSPFAVSITDIDI